MKVYLLHGDEDGIAHVFSSMAAAKAYSPDGYIDEREVYDAAPSKWKYWHRGAAVYPDGTYEEWVQEHNSDGEICIPPVDSHLNTRDEPWDGHTQGHCGEHISIFGTNQNLVEMAFQAILGAAIARQNGRCPTHTFFGCHKGVVDGVNFFDVGFMEPPRRSARLTGDVSATPLQRG